MISWLKGRLPPPRGPCEPDPPGVTISQRQVDAAYFASNVAMCVLVYFLWIYTLSIAKDRAEALHVTHAGGWVGDVQFWFPYIVGFAGIAYGIPYVAKNSIPTFMALRWDDGFWPKLWSLGIALFVSLVIIAGTFTVQGEAILEKDRDAAVKVEGLENEKAALAGNAAAIQNELNQLCAPDNQRPNYQQQACRAGAASWKERAAEADRQGDYQAAAIRRSIPDAERGDALRAELRIATRESFVGAGAVASVQRRVDGGTQATSWLGRTLDWVESIRAILLSLVMDVVCLMMPWIARHLELRRNVQLAMASEARAGWADEAHMLENKVGQPKEQTFPLDAKYQGPIVFQDGYEMKWVDGFVRERDSKWIPGHYRRTGARKREVEIDAAAVSPSDPRAASQQANAADEAAENARAEAGEMVGVGDGIQPQRPNPSGLDGHALRDAESHHNDGAGDRRAAETATGDASVQALRSEAAASAPRFAITVPGLLSERPEAANAHENDDEAQGQAELQQLAPQPEDEQVAEDERGPSAAQAEEAPQEPVEVAGGATDQGVHELPADDQGQPQDPLPVPASVYDALEERQLIKDGEIPDDMPTESVEKVAGWMADKRGLPAPEREKADAA